uniref:Crossover junction endonuclease MUS81-like HHH domain-containing protein n=1 Tax=Micromonas commoda virus TaxID=3057169 RepID=A0AAU7YMZ3_9PHYC
MMRISSVTDYILKLEKLNQESREKIDSLKELFLKSEEEKVKALRELNELKQKPTVSHVTLIPDETCPMNEEIANHLMLISLKESDVYKARAYKNAAEIIAKLTYEVTDGISCAKRTKGIGPSIAAKIDEFLDNYYNSEDDSDYDSDAESVASNDTGSFYSTDDEEDVIDTNEYIADELIILASKQGEDPFRARAYTKAAKIIRDLDFEVTCGADVYEGDKKLPGIGKSIAKKIDEILHTI